MLFNLLNGPASRDSSWAAYSSPKHGYEQVGIFQKLPTDDCLRSVACVGDRVRLPASGHQDGPFIIRVNSVPLRHYVASNQTLLRHVGWRRNHDVDNGCCVAHDGLGLCLPLRFRLVACGHKPTGSNHYPRVLRRHGAPVPGKSYSKTVAVFTVFSTKSSLPHLAQFHVG